MWLNNEIITITAILGVYLGAIWVFKKIKLALLHPLIISIFILVFALKCLHIPYAEFEQNSRIISFLLGPSVVALGFVLYQEVEKLKANALPILVSVFLGSFIGVASVVLIVRFFGADAALLASLEPKSVTTPIAMSISERSGGLPALTAVVVVVVGIFGAAIGPMVFKLLGIKSPLAKGLALGSAAHGLGTARAMELGALEGAVGGLAIGLMGLMTALLVPFINYFA